MILRLLCINKCYYLIFNHFTEIHNCEKYYFQTSIPLNKSERPSTYTRFIKNENKKSSTIKVELFKLSNCRTI